MRRHAKGNQPGPHMLDGVWGQQMWLFDRDLCHGFERAVLADPIRFAVLNLMSNNPGMRWDIDETRRVIGYKPQDGHATIITGEITEREEIVRLEYELADRLSQFALVRRW